MSTNTMTFRRGAELPGLTLPWQEETSQNVWTDLDLSGGTHTFTLTLVDADGVAQLTKTTNITGTTTGVTVTWAVDDLDIAEGVYTLRLRARETSSSKDRDYSPDNPVQINIV